MAYLNAKELENTDRHGNPKIKEEGIVLVTSLYDKFQKAARLGTDEIEHAIREWNAPIKQNKFDFITN